MAFMAIIRGLGLLFYILLGFELNGVSCKLQKKNLEGRRPDDARALDAGVRLWGLGSFSRSYLGYFGYMGISWGFRHSDVDND